MHFLQEVISESGPDLRSELMLHDRTGIIQRGSYGFQHVSSGRTVHSDRGAYNSEKEEKKKKFTTLSFCGLKKKKS